MFHNGDRVFYPGRGYGVGTVDKISESMVRGETGNVYHIEFDNGNSAGIFETPKLTLFDPTNERIQEQMASYTKKAQVGAKKTKGKASKALKAEKVEKPAVKKAAEATKGVDKMGWIPLKDAATRSNMSLSQFWNKKLATKEVESKQFGTRWYVKESTLA